MAWLPGCSLLAIACGDGSVQLWRLPVLSPSASAPPPAPFPVTPSSTPNAHSHPAAAAAAAAAAAGVQTATDFALGTSPEECSAVPHLVTVLKGHNDQVLGMQAVAWSRPAAPHAPTAADVATAAAQSVDYSAADGGISKGLSVLFTAGRDQTVRSWVLEPAALLQQHWRQKRQQLQQQRLREELELKQQQQQQQQLKDEGELRHTATSGVFVCVRRCVCVSERERAHVAHMCVCLCLCVTVCVCMFCMRVCV